MIKRILAALAVTLCVLPARAKTARFKVVGVAELEKALKSAAPPAVYDANGDDTREGAGIIPGAHLLASSKNYDAAKELPADKKTPLVFYCANRLCTASHSAAEKAIDAGYSDVSVMADGIYGWKKAGKLRAPGGGAPKKLEPQDVSALRDMKDAVIVDVREAEERHIVVPGARWMPMSKAADEKSWAAFASELPKDKSIVFHCAMGGRAKKAAEKLSKAGFRTAYFESADQWRKAGLPVEKGPAD